MSHMRQTIVGRYRAKGDDGKEYVIVRNARFKPAGSNDNPGGEVRLADDSAGVSVGLLAYCLFLRSLRSMPNQALP
jgi:hypothetical protein